MVPCALCDMQFKVALPEQDEIQLTVVGMALGLGEPLNTNKYKRKIVCRSLSKDQVRKSGIFSVYKLLFYFYQELLSDYRLFYITIYNYAIINVYFKRKINSFIFFFTSYTR